MSFYTSIKQVKPLATFIKCGNVKSDMKFKKELIASIVVCLFGILWNKWDFAFAEHLECHKIWMIFVYSLQICSRWHWFL